MEITFLQLKWLTRLGTVKHDGTVQLDVPGDIKTPSLDLVPVHTGGGEAAAEEDIDLTGIPDLPPMQIVMLIVGTRGDVQPFVAIGKRLQVLCIIPRPSDYMKLLFLTHYVCSYV